MADDLTSFFKSKKSKKHGSGQGAHVIVQTPDQLARRLERTVQQQQIFDRENNIEEDGDEFGQRPSYPQQFSSGTGSGGGEKVGEKVGGTGGEQNNEESEWLDFQEQQQDIDVAKSGLKEMDIREESDDEANDDDESMINRRTWNMPGQQQSEKQPQKGEKVTYAAGMDIDDGEDGVCGDDGGTAATKKDSVGKKEEGDTETATADVDKETEEAEKKPQKYVAPSMRNKQLTAVLRGTFSAKKPNIEDSMEFPSLAAAEELEAEIEKTKKKKPSQQAWKKAASPSPVSAPLSTPAESDRPPAWRRSERKPASTIAVDASEPVPETKPAAQSERPAYVPPHLRKRGGAS